MKELIAVGNIVADSAEKLLVRKLVEDPTLPGIVTGVDAEVAIDAVVRQDSKWTSKRVWAAVLSVATAVMLVPEVRDAMGPAADAVMESPDVKTLLGEWAPFVTVLVASVLSLFSKLFDPRPTR